MQFPKCSFKFHLFIFQARTSVSVDSKRTHTILTMENVVKDWLVIANNKNEECRCLERDSLAKQLTISDRREIDEKFTDLDEDASRWEKYRDEVQINKRLTYLLMKFRNGLIQPGKTNKAYKRGLVGGDTCQQQGKRLKARNAKHNPTNNLINGPINGPIISQRKQEELRAEHALELSKSKYKGEVSFLGKEGAKAKADSIVLAIHCFKLIVRVHTSYNLSSRTSFQTWRLYDFFLHLLHYSRRFY